MGQRTLANGTTGAVIRAQINDNFTELFGDSAFPVGPADGDRHYRKDRGIDYFYSAAAANWLSVNLLPWAIASQGVVNPMSASFDVFSPNPGAGLYSIYVERLLVHSYLTTVTSANYFTFQLKSLLGAATTNLGATVTSQNSTINQHVLLMANIGVVVPSTEAAIGVAQTETGTASAFHSTGILFRWVG